MTGGVQDWPLVPLAELGSWHGGGTPSKANEAYWTNGTVPWLSPKDMGPEVVRATQDTITTEAVGSSATRLVPAGSVAIVVRSGILERTVPIAVVPMETSLNQDMKALVPRGGLDPRWVAWGLRSRERWLLDHCRKAGTTVASLDTKRLLSVTLPVPPLEEQRRILDVLEDHLSRLAAGVASAAAAAARARALEMATAAGLVRSPTSDGTREMAFGNVQLPLPETWAASRVGDEACLVEYGTGAKTGDASVHDAVPVLRMGNVKNGSLDLGSLKYLPGSHSDFPRLLLESGDLLFNRTNSAEHVGKSAVYQGELGAASFASYLIRARFKAGVLPQWANLVINSLYGRAYVSSVVSQQVGQANVNGTKLKNFPLPVPPVETQLELLTRYEQVRGATRRLEDATQQLAARARLLRAALLGAAFSGRLTTPSAPEELEKP